MDTRIICDISGLEAAFHTFSILGLAKTGVAARPVSHPYYDSYRLTATVRLAFINFDNEVAYVLYNLAV